MCWTHQASKAQQKLSAATDSDQDTHDDISFRTNTSSASSPGSSWTQFGSWPFLKLISRLSSGRLFALHVSHFYLFFLFFSPQQFVLVLHQHFNIQSEQQDADQNSSRSFSPLWHWRDCVCPLGLISVLISVLTSCHSPFKATDESWLTSGRPCLLKCREICGWTPLKSVVVAVNSSPSARNKHTCEAEHVTV